MVTIDLTNLYSILAKQRSVTYESQVRRFANEYAERVMDAAWENVSLPSPITCRDTRKYLRIVTFTALGSFLSSFVRRDAKYDRNDLSDAYGLHDDWMQLRKAHGIDEPHPSSKSFLGDLEKLQWNYCRAAEFYREAAEFNLSRDNKYPALPNLFNASYCNLRSGDCEESERTLRELEAAIGRIREIPDWQDKYKKQSLTSFKEFDLELWSHLGWCDHYIHHPNWNTDEGVRAAFEGKWDLLTSGRNRQSVLTLDLATNIYSDPQWMKNQREIADVIWQTLHVDYSKGRIVKVARVLELLIQKRIVEYGKVAAGLALACILAFGTIQPAEATQREDPSPYVQTLFEDMQDVGLMARETVLDPMYGDKLMNSVAKRMDSFSDSQIKVMYEIRDTVDREYLNLSLFVGPADQDRTGV